MQIREFYRYESHGETPEFYEGRWKLNYWASWDKGKPNGLYYIEWIDLFGQEETMLFTVQIPVGMSYIFYPLTKQFGILHVCWSPDGETRPFFAIKLDWLNKTGIVGTKSIQSTTTPDSEYWTILMDRAELHDGIKNINFLLYEYDNIHQLCQLDTDELELRLLGDPFELPREKFSCLSLNGNIISGLDATLDKINHFCLHSKQFLPPLKIHGLPSNIYCVYPNDVSTRPGSRRRAAGLWTPDRLYVWSQVGELNNSLSVIYFIELNTGVATAVDIVFDNRIRRLYLSQDGFLHVRNDKIIGFGRRNRNGDFVPGSHGTTRDLLTNYRFFRLPIKTPETLFSLSYAALPSSYLSGVNEIVEKFVNKHKNVPKLVY